MPTCPMCLIAEKYIKTVDHHAKFIMVNKFFEDYLSKSEKEKFIERLSKKPLEIPLVLRLVNNQWKVFDISPFVKRTLERIQKDFKL